MHSHTIIILLSGIVILSYAFNILSRRTGIPSVLLLIGAGIGIQYASHYYGYLQQDVSSLVKVLGAIGLLLIVLEAALDLEVNRSKGPLIGRSALSALSIFLLSAFAIAWLINVWLHEPFERAFLYAVPMSIISSAVVIPSTEHLPEHKKEFVIYESSFSDIIGILVFNYMLMKNVLSWASTGVFLGNILLAILISVVSSVVMVFILSRITIQLKFFLLFAVLSLLYATGELIKLPSLLIVLVFGLVLNNSRIIFRGKLRKVLPRESIKPIVDQLKVITAETSFLLRTFFFILFGYSIQLKVLVEQEVWQLGSLIVLALLAVRFIYLRLILKTHLFPELLLMPRGLITILLFYSIPADKALASFNGGVIFFVVSVTSVLMMVGILLFKKQERGLAAETEQAEGHW